MCMMVQMLSFIDTSAHFTLSLLYLIVVYSILQAPPQDHPWQGGQGQA